MCHGTENTATVADVFMLSTQAYQCCRKCESIPHSIWLLSSHGNLHVLSTENRETLRLMAWTAPCVNSLHAVTIHRTDSIDQPQTVLELDSNPLKLSTVSGH